MKVKDCWTKLFVFPGFDVRPLALFNDGDQAVLVYINGELVTYNFKTEEAARLRFHYFAELCEFDSVEYSETLVSPSRFTKDILHTTGSSQFRDVQLFDTKQFGKALVIDGKLQSGEIDEFIHHESLVHPALLHHPSPKTAFIMGSGEGSTAREILRHKSIEKVVMCYIHEEVVEFCKAHLVVNREAFSDPRLDLIVNDARAELESRKDCFDVIICDLADPIDHEGPCCQLYSKSFYELIVKPRLNQGGVFVTQAGPAGTFYHTKVFSCIYKNLKDVFNYVVPFAAHIPSYANNLGWAMASDDIPFDLDCDELDQRIKDRIKGENRYLDGKTFSSATTSSRAVRTLMHDEPEVRETITIRII